MEYIIKENKKKKSKEIAETQFYVKNILKIHLWDWLIKKAKQIRRNNNFIIYHFTLNILNFFNNYVIWTKQINRTDN